MRSSKAQTEIDLDEDEIDYDDEEGGAYMNASEMLDAGDYDDSEDSEVSPDEKETPFKSAFDEEESELSISEASNEDDEDEDLDSSAESQVDEEYEGALSKLSSFVDGLESKKRKAEDVDQSGKKKKRVVLKERTEAFAEGEYVAINAQDGTADGSFAVCNFRNYY